MIREFNSIFVYICLFTFYSACVAQTKTITNQVCYCFGLGHTGRTPGKQTRFLSLFLDILGGVDILAQECKHMIQKCGRRGRGVITFSKNEVGQNFFLMGGSKLFQKYMRGGDGWPQSFFLAPSLTSVYSAKNGGKYFFGGKGVLINMFFFVFLEGRRWKIQKMWGLEMGDPKNGG